MLAHVPPHVATYIDGLEKRLEALEARMEAFEGASSFKAAKAAVESISGDQPVQQAKPEPKADSSKDEPVTASSSSGAARKP